MLGVLSSLYCYIGCYVILLVFVKFSFHKYVCFNFLLLFCFKWAFSSWHDISHFFLLFEMQISIWEERKVFGSRGQILKEELVGRQSENNSSRNGRHLGLKLVR